MASPRAWMSLLGIAAALASPFALLPPRAGAFHPKTSAFYEVRPDPRLCPSPLCGGASVRLLNVEQTLCGDGALREECYVTGLDWSPSAAPADDGSRARAPGAAPSLIVTGAIEPRDYGQFGNLGILRVERAWTRTVSPDDPTGLFYVVRDSGIRCITFPCPSLEAGRLNSEDHLSFSDLDLSAINAIDPRAARDAADAGPGDFLFRGEIALVPNAGPAGDGRSLIVNAVYRRCADCSFPRTEGLVSTYIGDRKSDLSPRLIVTRSTKPIANIR